MSNNLDQDIKTCLDIINNKKISDRGSGKIYRSTNELLTSILKEEQFKDKDVLTVMASSDQVFSAYYYDAKHVDTFDSNILAYYYFFLRKWSILGSRKTYLSANNNELMDYLEQHDYTKEELRAYKFWKEVLSNIKESLYYSSLFHHATMSYTTPFQNNIDDLIYSISKAKPNFHHLNIFEPINLTKQYDTIVLSNILEYLYEEPIDEKYYRQLGIVINNLLKLTKKGGIIISSNILDSDYSNNRHFERYFEYKEGSLGPGLRNNQEMPLSYTYKKK